LLKKCFDVKYSVLALEFHMACGIRLVHYAPGTNTEWAEICLFTESKASAIAMCSCAKHQCQSKETGYVLLVSWAGWLACDNWASAESERVPGSR